MFDEEARSRYDPASEMSTRLGTLGFHLDGRPCRVGCEFCYLGARTGAGVPELDRFDAALAADIVGAAPARDVAIAVSEPAGRWRAAVERIAGAARARGLPVAITTTPAVVASEGWIAAACDRLALSVDSAKGDTDPRSLAAVAVRLVRRGLELVAMVTVESPQAADRLARGALAELLAARSIDVVCLNALKPPPVWADRAFWLRFLARLGPLLDANLGRRLHLDCYVGARLLGLGGCPGKLDVAFGGEVRACVYQQAPSVIIADAADFVRRLVDLGPPGTCPFAVS